MFWIIFPSWLKEGFPHLLYETKLDKRKAPNLYLFIVKLHNSSIYASLHQPGKFLFMPLNFICKYCLYKQTKKLNTDIITKEKISVRMCWKQRRKFQVGKAPTVKLFIEIFQRGIVSRPLWLAQLFRDHCKINDIFNLTVKIDCPNT